MPLSRMTSCSGSTGTGSELPTGWAPPAEPPQVHSSPGGTISFHRSRPAGCAVGPFHAPTRTPLTLVVLSTLLRSLPFICSFVPVQVVCQFKIELSVFALVIYRSSRRILDPSALWDIRIASVFFNSVSCLYALLMWFHLNLVPGIQSPLG